MEALNQKYDRLCSIIKDLKRVAVAYSGGVDSTLLLYAAAKTLGENAIAVTVRGGSFPEREYKETEEFCREYGISRFVWDSDALLLPEFVKNTPERCYICKRHFLKKIKEIAGENGVEHVIEGSNADDTKDYRPGMRAVKELGIKSPLLMAGLSKDEIRRISEIKGLPTFKKPAYACLATRIPYGEKIIKEKLTMIEKAEDLLILLGFPQVRVRVRNKDARIEIPEENFPKIVEPSVKNGIINEFIKLGFNNITLDLKGYRMGSMNKDLK